MTKNLPLFLRSMLASLLILVSFGARANHIVGMDLGYTWVSGTTYRITLTVFGDCGVTTPSLTGATPVVCVYNNTTAFASIVLNQEAPAAGTEITPVCAASIGSTTCSGGTIPGVRRFTYSNTVTLPTTSANWRFIFNGNMNGSGVGGGVSAGRLFPGITNLGESASTIIQLTATLNNTSGNNGTPALTVGPTPYFCQNNVDNYSPGAVDADGDSLVFSLVSGRKQTASTNCSTANGGSNVVYNTAGGYSATDPIHHYAGAFTFNSSTGQMSFTPDIAHRALVVYNIQEYRGGVLVGSSQREMNFLIQACSVPPPTGDITTASAGTITDSVHFEICQNSGPFNFHIIPTSESPTLNIEVTATGLPAGSTFTVAGNNTPTPDATFSWNATTAAPGVYNFYVSYKDDNCPISGTNTQAFTVTINPQPTTFTGTAIVCAGQTTTLSNSLTGGTWTSATPAVATVGLTTGVVTGVTAGTATISYTLSTGCVGTTVVTVNASPAAIGGTLSVCEGLTTTLTNSVAGGTWTSSNAAVATIGSATGIVTGVTAGTATVSYTLANGCFSTATVTVNAVPAAITGTATVCVGATTALANATAGGTWSSSNPAVASVVTPSLGIITGVSAGTATITYSLGTGCRAVRVVTVNPNPAAINPTTPTTICVGSTTAFTNATAGGTWSSSNAAVASVTTLGLVTGNAAGTATISYTLSTGCFAVKTVTVNTAPAAIVPSSTTVCAGSTGTLTNTVTGGSWSSSNTAVVTVGSATGIITGVSAGVANITYSIGTCFSVAAVTVNAVPAAISPAAATTLCVGSNTTFTNATAGGTWTSSNTAVATAGLTTGIIAGTGAGTATISYIVSATGCFVTKPVTVNTAPAAITPAGANVCAGSTTTLSNTTAGGTWSSTNTAVATVGATTGIVTGVAAGTATISYAAGSCGVAVVVTVNPLPAAITGTATVCVGATTALANATAGGTWSSSNTAIATVGAATGVVTGVAGGTTTISYTLPTGCSSTTVVTVNSATTAGTITGPATLCVGAFTIYTTTGTGGVWSTSNSNATITGGGVATGVTAGTVTISYTVSGACGVASATRLVTINAVPTAGTISGPTTVCEGSDITLTTTGTGGSWSSSNATVATIGSTSGVLTGVSAGVVGITYTVSNSCGTATATYAVTVNPLGSAGTLGGPSAVCVSGLITLTSTATGGVWSASNSNATVGSTTGIVTGVNPGIDTITYTIISGCGLASASKVVTISALPTGGTISGPASVCVGSTVTLSSTEAGGVWSVSNTNATISADGVVTGVAAGGVNITYTVTNICGTATSSTSMTVIALPTAGTLSGPDSVCIGTTITLASTVAGGTWINGNSHASVDAAGVVTGITAGTVPITYTVTNVCGVATAVKVIEVLGPPTAGVLSGPSGVCVGSGITVTSTVSGGVWVASNANASIVAPGIILGVTPGLDTIFYTVTNLCGTDVASKIISVNPIPAVTPIMGLTSHCVGTTITKTNTTPDGIWTSSDMAVATVGLSTGIVTGISAGTTLITYTVTSAEGCPASVTAPDTVLAVPTPAPITGTGNLCLGVTTTLSNATLGGTWSSSSAAVATIGAAGDATGVTPGTATISYTVSNLCGIAVVTTVVTVNTNPTVIGITGTAQQCVGNTTTLANATAGGTWSSADVTIATVGATTGVVTGLAAGVADISYTVTNAAGCTATATVQNTVNALPTVAPITGPTTVCVGGMATLSSATAGGTWSSSNPLLATVGATSGVVTGIAVGEFTVSYTYTDGLGCSATVTMADTVISLPAPGPITGGLAVCEGATTTLASTTTGGTWTSSDPLVATVDAVSGVVSGLAAGTTIINYEVTTATGCTTMLAAVVTVNALPAAGPITGLAEQCAGATTTLGSSAAGGTWSSSDAAVATVGSGTGVVTGVAAGTATITYTVTSAAGCTAFATIVNTVNPLPAVAAITGLAEECLGGTTTLSTTTPAGVWSSSNVAIATVDAASGVVTGVAAGTAVISYSVTGAFGCTGVATVVNTVSVLPVASPITGALNACIGSTTTLSNAVAGGTWTSADVTVATIGAASGVLTGVSVGTAVISYTVTNSCGSVTNTAIVTVNTLPAVAPIAGAISTLCGGTTTTLSSTTPGGVWSSSNVAVATVSTSGVVTGVATGTAMITYTVTSSAGCSNFVTFMVTVAAPMMPMAVMPLTSATLCDSNVRLYVTPPVTGLTYQWMINGLAIAGATAADYTADSPGVYSVLVSNGTCSQVLSGTTVYAKPNATIGFNPPNILFTGSFATYQWYKDGVAIAGANTSILTLSGNGAYTVKVTDVNGCSDSSDAYIEGPVTGVAGTAVVTEVNIYPNPATAVLNIDAKVAVNVKLVTMDGKVVADVRNAKAVDVRNLATGLYMIMVYDEQHQLLKTAKFTKGE